MHLLSDISQGYRVGEVGKDRAMSWLGSRQKDEEIVEVALETDVESLEKGIFVLDGYTMAKSEDSHEKEFYCGLCRGWVPISQFPTHRH
jgi:hypothetical protein